MRRTSLQHVATRRLFSTFVGTDVHIQTINRLNASYDTVDITDFRKQAFAAEHPLLIASGDTADSRTTSNGLPAAHKWFEEYEEKPRDGALKSRKQILSQSYLSKFGDTIVPYELIIDPQDGRLQEWIKHYSPKHSIVGLTQLLSQLLEVSDGVSFHRFNAPLSFFLQACNVDSPILKKLYIAQAQISDLPLPLQNDLPTPRLVKEAGKGDVYDANVWLGVPPTYTPLHKDPNPNLFVQLASSKRVRLFEPRVGSSIFREVQQRIGQQTSASFRGSEMMEGPERDALHAAVWDEPRAGVFEVVVGAGDALFIPKGFWHSIKSVGEDVTASVNWWFR